MQFVLWRDARSGIVRITDVNESGIRDVGHLGKVVREAVSERNFNDLRSIDGGMMQNCFEGRIGYDQSAALRSCESFRAEFQHLARSIAQQDLVGRDIVQLRQFLNQRVRIFVRVTTGEMEDVRHGLERLRGRAIGVFVGTQPYNSR